MQVSDFPFPDEREQSRLTKGIRVRVVALIGYVQAGIPHPGRLVFQFYMGVDTLDELGIWQDFKLSNIVFRLTIPYVGVKVWLIFKIVLALPFLLW
jgi:hypothetical protein